MITLIEAKGFRCLQYVRQPLGPFHVLVGPNASGKTTFLDVVAFLGQLVGEGLDSALNSRSANFNDLLWQRQGDHFELAIEAHIPEDKRKLLTDSTFDTVRYEIALRFDGGSTNEVGIGAEKAFLKKSAADPPLVERQGDLFPNAMNSPDTVITPARARGGIRLILSKSSGGNDNFYSEVYVDKNKGWVPSFRLGPRRSTLGNLPEDESKLPVATWLKRLLSEGIQTVVLNSELMRKASPPGQGRRFKTDGSNLPWVIDDLDRRAPEKISDWIAHLQTALPDLAGIRTVERPDDKHRYLMLKYSGGLEVPSWMVSDGTLRLLALTLPAYIPGLDGVYLIEEPENGIHPKAVETMFQSLSSVYDAQIILATHSPLILGMAKPADILCFAKTPEGATDIVSGDKHPALRDWQGEVDLGVLFAGGVLG